jgi:hypothetical protein
MMKILHKISGTVLYEDDSESMKNCAVAAVISGANLSYADLSYADIRGADLSYAYLSRANLSYADLSGANLRGADIRGADLSYAYLSRANLSYANLSGANLRGADIRGANLGGADIGYADLRGVSEVISAGSPDSWSAFAWLDKGIVMLQIGCRLKTIAEGREYWAGKENRREVLAAIDYIETVAKLRGWIK